VLVVPRRRRANRVAAAGNIQTPRRALMDGLTECTRIVTGRLALVEVKIARRPCILGTKLGDIVHGLLRQAPLPNAIVWAATIILRKEDWFGMSFEGMEPTHDIRHLAKHSAAFTARMAGVFALPQVVAVQVDKIYMRQVLRVWQHAAHIRGRKWQRLSLGLSTISNARKQVWVIAMWRPVHVLELVLLATQGHSVLATSIPGCASTEVVLVHHVEDDVGVSSVEDPVGGFISCTLDVCVRTKDSPHLVEVEILDNDHHADTVCFLDDGAQSLEEGDPHGTIRGEPTRVSPIETGRVTRPRRTTWRPTLNADSDGIEASTRIVVQCPGKLP